MWEIVLFVLEEYYKFFQKNFCNNIKIFIFREEDKNEAISI